MKRGPAVGRLMSDVEADDQTVAHIPPDARHVLAPIDAAGARQLRAHLLNRLKR